VIRPFSSRLEPALWRVRRRIRSANYLRKWVVLGAVIGVVGGLGAIVFYTALDLATHVFLGVLAGYAPPSPVGEAARRSPRPPDRGHFRSSSVSVG
jgi:CIC family chloride channel protein